MKFYEAVEQAEREIDWTVAPWTDELVDAVVAWVPRNGSEWIGSTARAREIADGVATVTVQSGRGGVYRYVAFRDQDAMDAAMNRWVQVQANPAFWTSLPIKHRPKPFILIPSYAAPSVPEDLYP